MMCYKLRFAIFYGVMWDCGLPHFMGHAGTCGSGRVGFIQSKVEASANAYRNNTSIIKSQRHFAIE
jgi:hypothetical protein